MQVCNRCGQEKSVSAIGEALYHFVCDTCRLDNATWDFNNVHLATMEYESPEPYEIKARRWEKLNANEYR